MLGQLLAGEFQISRYSSILQKLEGKKLFLNDLADGLFS
jgi:hypothetical protein